MCPENLSLGGGGGGSSEKVAIHTFLPAIFTWKTYSTVLKYKDNAQDAIYIEIDY